MGQQIEVMVQRLRRFARALTQDTAGADALVLEALAATEDKRMDFHRILTFIIARRRDQEELQTHQRQARPVPKTGSRPDILRVFEHLSLQDREVIALISVERLSYEDAAAVLALREEAFIARLTRARAAFARQIDGERHTILRIVK
ncbi:sigma factor-like helix-turn-helix DNA-binding protein [Labrys monachus]|uniref:RNA polymerase sigma-70 factor (ECF subfamily) n=1 Tax=Labrys monachus TaxID=217067 RepID=A0ABU0FAY9_9HYPH|nr:sigma factor-like helix-turn-helix DNA-binding protein [Labrys monachus]MDQ0391716.1 RNA polymerase sigma-70 factor (ECF subfamily) [Labrys monachus]